MTRPALGWWTWLAMLARWLLVLAVRVLRAPAVRRRLLPLLFPGCTTTASGRVYQDRWEVAVPALGSRCVPGCDDPSVDWDGLHYCRVVIGQIHDLPPTSPGGAHRAVVEVTQVQGEPRHVWLLGLDDRGGYANDGWRVSPAAAGELAALLDTAFVVAGRPTSGLVVDGGELQHAAQHRADAQRDDAGGAR